VESAGWKWGKPSFYTSPLFHSRVRIAYWLLEGTGRGRGKKETILLPHGEPTWSFLNRRLVEPFLAAGHR